MERTGAPPDVIGGMPATADLGEVAGVGEATGLGADERATFAAIADHLIPAAHGMPSAAEVVTDERLGSVLTSRPDLVEPLKAALRSELGPDIGARLAKLSEEPTE